MPIECTILRDQPEPLAMCPKCGASPFVGFMRGTVQKMGVQLLIEKAIAWFRRHEVRYCMIICGRCRDIVGHEPCSGETDG